MLIIFFKGSFKESFKGQYFNCFEYLANILKLRKILLFVRKFY